METGEAGGWRAAAQQPPRPSLGLAPRPPQPASAWTATPRWRPIPCCPLHQEQTTAADDVHQGARKHMPSLSFFPALSYAVAARLDSPGSALFESCEAFHAPSHPLPLRRYHDFARPLRRVPTPDPDLEPWWLSRPPIPVGPQQARSSQLAARSQQLPLARRQPADPSDSSDEATR